jgi:uncharacterized protein (DUF885 family)
MELWRTCRLVVDTVIRVKAIERCIAMPGQATAYLIGKLKIMELQTQA